MALAQITGNSILLQVPRVHPVSRQALSLVGPPPWCSFCNTAPCFPMQRAVKNTGSRGRVGCACRVEIL